MKKLLLVLAFCVPFFIFSQEVERVDIKGRIIIEGRDIEGITIYNSTANAGTISNKEGEFTITAALNDLLEIRALKFQNLDVKVNKAILDSKKVSVFLIEEINKLDEIIVTSNPLSGNLASDIDQIQIFKPKNDVLYFGLKNKDFQKLGDDERRLVENEAQHGKINRMIDGLNIVNVVDQLLIPLFRSEVKDKKAMGVPEVPVNSIKYYFGASFLNENFGIPKHRVEEFIRYVEDDAFDFNLLNYGHEIEFLELLNKKSEMFLSPLKAN